MVHKMPKYIKEQLPIPGLDISPHRAKGSKPLHIEDRVKALESRVIQLEAGYTLLLSQLIGSPGDEDYA